MKFNLRLVDYESEIRKLVESNPQDPEIYNKLQEMVRMFLLRKKASDSSREIEEVSYTIAGDMFMQIINGEKIDYYLGYLDKIYRPYFKDYYDSRKYLEPYDPSLDGKRVLRRFTTTQDYSKVVNKVYFEEVDKIIDQVMEKCCKYRKGTSTYLNLKLSIILSLRSGSLVPFHLSKEESFYLRILVISLYRKIRKSGVETR